MKASSESGLWATWMVLAMKLLLRLFLKLVQRGLVFQILDPLRRRFRSIVGEKVSLRLGLSRRVVLQPRDGSSNQIAEQMTGRLSEDRIRQGQRRRKVSHLQVQHGGVIAGIGITAVQLLVSAQRHRREALHLNGIAPFGGLHDPVEEPVEALLR